MRAISRSAGSVVGCGAADHRPAYADAVLQYAAHLPPDLADVDRQLCADQLRRAERLSGRGAAAGVISAASRRVRHAGARVAQIPAAVTGAAMSTYTGALLAATSTPLWAALPKLLPASFGASAMASAAAALVVADGRRLRARDAAPRRAGRERRRTGPCGNAAGQAPRQGHRNSDRRRAGARRWGGAAAASNRRGDRAASRGSGRRNSSARPAAPRVLAKRAPSRCWPGPFCCAIWFCGPATSRRSARATISASRGRGEEPDGQGRQQHAADRTQRDIAPRPRRARSRARRAIRLRRSRRGVAPLGRAARAC